MPPKSPRSTPGSPSTDRGGPQGGLHNAQGCLDHLFHGFATTSASRWVFTDSADVLEDMDRKTVAVLQRVRALQNASKPAARLPQEILSIVFMFVAHPPPNATPQPASCIRTPKFQRGWMCVRLVCQSWRQAADSCPDLWTKIFVAPVAGEDARRLTPSEVADRDLATTRLFLRNSCVGKLDVVLELNQSPQHDIILAETMGELHRIRDLQLLRKGPSAPESIELICNTPAPCLEALVVDMPLQARALLHETEQDGSDEQDGAEDETEEDDSENGDEQDDAEDVTDAADRVLPTIFNAHTPALRSLTLRKFTTFPSNQFHSVVQLHLFNLDLSDLETLQPIADFLDGLPLLEDLIFTDIDASETLRAVRPASLPNLKSLYVVRSWYYGWSIAETVNQPTEVGLTIHHGRSPYFDLVYPGGADWSEVAEFFNDFSTFRASYSDCFGEVELRFAGYPAVCWAYKFGFDEN